MTNDESSAAQGSRLERWRRDVATRPLTAKEKYGSLLAFTGITLVALFAGMNVSVWPPTLETWLVLYLGVTSSVTLWAVMVLLQHAVYRRLYARRHPELGAVPVLPAPTLRPAVLWLFPGIFLLHESEEVLTVPAWVRGHGELLHMLSDPISPGLRIIANLPDSMAVMAGTMFFELPIYLAATIFLWRWLNRPSSNRAPLYIYSGLLAAYIAHVLVHIGMAAVARAYSPGIITGALIVLPAGVWLYHRLLKATPLSHMAASLSAAAGIWASIRIVLAAQAFGRRLFG
ncbi:MAG: HXXEE domain-containing protein [Acidobacteria bacterium]|nr:HXXEE domain-containing protein [Acidobacteriota bacterium]